MKVILESVWSLSIIVIAYLASGICLYGADFKDGKSLDALAMMLTVSGLWLILLSHVMGKRGNRK